MVLHIDHLYCSVRQFIDRSIFLYIIVLRMRNTKTFHVAYSVCEYIHFRIYNLLMCYIQIGYFMLWSKNYFFFLRILMLIERNKKIVFDILHIIFSYGKLFL